MRWHLKLKVEGSQKVSNETCIRASKFSLKI